MFWQKKYFVVVTTLMVGVSLLVFPNPKAQAASPATFKNSDIAAPAGQETPVALDSSLESFLQGKIADNGRVKLDLFVMSQCPFGVLAEQALIPKVTEWEESVEFNLYFIANEDGSGGFESLHGPAEVEEDIRQVVIAKYYPDQFLSYVLARSADYTSDNWQQYATEVGIDVDKVQQIAVSEEGKELLRANIQSGIELNIGASPTLFVDDEEYMGAIFAIPDATGSDGSVSNCGTTAGGSSTGSSDPADLDKLIQSKIADNSHVKVDLFVMSQCPFGVMAEQALIPKVMEWGKSVEFNLYFIASEDGNGGFESLHGQAEVDEDIRQVVIAKYYPGKFLSYVLARSADYASDNWQQSATEVGIDADKLQQIVMSEEGKELLRANIKVGNNLNIGASPTLFVDDKEYTGAIFGIPDTTGSDGTAPSAPDTTVATGGFTAKTGWLLFTLVVLVSLELAGLILRFRLRHLGGGTNLRQQWPLLAGLLVLIAIVVAGSYGLWLKPTYFEGTVAGQVLDAETGTPIEGASVTIHGTRLVTKTDANGEYRFAKVPMGTRKIVAQHADFTMDVQETIIVGGQAIESFALYLTKVEPLTVIGSSGGTIHSAGSPILEVPAGALATDTEITVTQLLQVPNLASLSRVVPSEMDDQTSILMAVDFGPDGTTFSKPVTVSFMLPTPAPDDLKISIFRLDSKILEWSLEETVSVKKGESMVIFQVDHFSPYAGRGRSSMKTCTDAPGGKKCPWDYAGRDPCCNNNCAYGWTSKKCCRDATPSPNNENRYITSILGECCFGKACIGSAPHCCGFQDCYNDGRPSLSKCCENNHDPNSRSYSTLTNCCVSGVVVPRFPATTGACITNDNGCVETTACGCNSIYNSTDWSAGEKCCQRDDSLHYKPTLVQQSGCCEWARGISGWPPSIVPPGSTIFSNGSSCAEIISPSIMDPQICTVCLRGTWYDPTFRCLDVDGNGKCVIPECLDDADCNDNNPCTQNKCDDDYTCSYPPVCSDPNAECCPEDETDDASDYTCCGDGEFCTQCSEGSCCGNGECNDDGTCSTNGVGSLPAPFAGTDASAQSISSQGGLASFDNGFVQVNVLPESVTGTVRLVYISQNASQQIDGFHVKRLFAMDAYTATCQPQKFTDFSKPVSIQVSYSPKQVDEVDEGQLGLYNFNSALNQWVELPGQVDTEANTVTAELEYFGLNGYLYALMLPAASVEPEASNGTGTWMGIVLTTLAVVLIGLRWRRQRIRPSSEFHPKQ